MSDPMPWTLEARFAQRVVAGIHRGRVAGLAGALKAAAELRSHGRLEIDVEHRGPLLIVHTSRREQLETVRRALDVVLLDAELSAEVMVTHRRGQMSEREVVAGPYRAPRSRHGGRTSGVHSEPLLSPSAQRRWLIISLIGAVAGAAYYALAPGVASTQIGLPLTLPMLIIVSVWLHRRLPNALQWALAVPLAIAGPVSYAVIGGAQLWAWGKVAVFPLVWLLFDRAVFRRGISMRSSPWYGGPTQGPYGPP